MAKLVSVKIVDTPDGVRVYGRVSRGKNRKNAFVVDVPSKDPLEIRKALTGVKTQIDLDIPL